MPGKRFTKEEDIFLTENINKYNSYRELTVAFNTQFKCSRNWQGISDRCSKQLKLHREENIGLSYGRIQKPVGTICKDSRGYLFIKMAMNEKGTKAGLYMKEPYWIPLQKKIYQDNFGNIPNGYMIVFLDGDKENFDLNNLYPINRKILAVMSKNRWWTSNKDNTLAAIKYCELYYAIH